MYLFIFRILFSRTYILFATYFLYATKYNIFQENIVYLCHRKHYN